MASLLSIKPLSLIRFLSMKLYKILWNTLPQNMVELPSLASFKDRLAKRFRNRKMNFFYGILKCLLWKPWPLGRIIFMEQGNGKKEIEDITWPREGFMVWFFIDVYIINRTLHVRLEIRNFSSLVEKIFHKKNISFATPTREIFFNTRREILYLRAAK